MGPRRLSLSAPSVRPTSSPLSAGTPHVALSALRTTAAEWLVAVFGQNKAVALGATGTAADSWKNACSLPSGILAKMSCAYPLLLGTRWGPHVLASAHDSNARASARCVTCLMCRNTTCPAHHVCLPSRPAATQARHRPRSATLDPTAAQDTRVRTRGSRRAADRHHTPRLLPAHRYPGVNRLPGLASP